MTWGSLHVERAGIALAGGERLLGGRGALQEDLVDGGGAGRGQRDGATGSADGGAGAAFLPGEVDI